MIKRKVMAKLNFNESKSIGLFLNGTRGFYIFNQIVDREDVTIKWVVLPNSSTITDNLNSTKNYKKFVIQNSLELNEITHELEQVDILICAGFPFKIPKQIILKSSITSINLHGGPLPTYRGGSPIMWQIINGEKRIGISLHELSEEIDTGDVILESNFLLDSKWSISDVQSVANIEFSKLLNQFFSDCQSLLKNKHAQSKKEARYWHQRNPQDGSVDWSNKDSFQIYNFVRAISNPYSGAFGTLFSGGFVRLWEVECDEVPVCGATGRVVVLSDGPHVVCGLGGSVLLTKFDSTVTIRNGDRFIV